MKQQTAVEWLVEQLEVFVTLDEELTWDKLFQQAKQMEKEQIMDAHYQGYRNEIGTTEVSEQYYNETFKTKDQ